ncbi:hypothetical protein [Nocardiopsis sp. LDBS1602]|uniref:hypothetical protein n=1 Tax=Nocardiopsis sp. LDBS1602 TaxID=3109597 RepID=UPI002DBB8CAE|nr:hypothetical protein [Nocardiopsis sp. LDBS1602]MEC3895427.1 hypothetical protein [Nocardiopsis sp. LDBS1602]
MTDELAPVLWVAAGLEIDPNLDDFGLAPDQLRTFLYVSPGKRRSYSKGDLLCTRCLKIPVRRDKASMYVRSKRLRDGFWEVAHHSSEEGSCDSVESDERKAWRDRIATNASDAGLSADYGVGAKGRADVVVLGPEGRQINWQIQIAQPGRGAITKRTNTVYRNGHTPSWLTTDYSAKSQTRELINKVPWSMANKMLPEQLLHGRAAWVSDGISAYRWEWCRNIPGRCPVPGPLTLDCGKEHGIWERSPTRLEEFIENSAGGLLVPIAIPSANMRTVSRLWVTPDHYEEYAHAQGRPFTEADLPPHLRALTTPTHRINKGYESHDSILHQPQKRRSRSTGGARTPRAPGHDTPTIPIPTRERPPTTTEPPNDTALPPEIAAWIADSMPGQEHEPCHHYLREQDRLCGATPTRAYISGRRCWKHTPTPFTGNNSGRPGKP